MKSAVDGYCFCKSNFMYVWSFWVYLPYISLTKIFVSKPGTLYCAAERNYFIVKLFSFGKNADTPLYISVNFAGISIRGKILFFRPVHQLSKPFMVFVSSQRSFCKYHFFKAYGFSTFWDIKRIWQGLPVQSELGKR